MRGSLTPAALRSRSVVVPALVSVLVTVPALVPVLVPALVPVLGGQGGGFDGGWGVFPPCSALFYPILPYSALFCRRAGLAGSGVWIDFTGVCTDGFHWFGGIGGIRG